MHETTGHKPDNLEFSYEPRRDFTTLRPVARSLHVFIGSHKGRNRHSHVTSPGKTQNVRTQTPRISSRPPLQRLLGCLEAVDANPGCRCFSHNKVECRPLNRSLPPQSTASLRLGSLLLLDATVTLTPLQSVNLSASFFPEFSSIRSSAQIGRQISTVVIRSKVRRQFGP